MIIIEFFIKAIKTIWYYIARFFVWIITARDCKHCKYGEEDDFYDGYGIWYCAREDKKYTIECMNSICRVCFERKEKGDCK